MVQVQITSGPYTRRTVSDGQVRPTRTKSSDEDGPSAKKTSTPTCSQVDFETKYSQRQLLGEGAFGSVYGGYREEDFLPVAIKYIPVVDVEYVPEVVDGKTSQVPLEVMLMLRVADAASVGKNAAVALLDWYEQDGKLILVMERPTPSVDLLEYVDERDGVLREHEAKILIKQLLSGILDIHSKGVFHRDIKMENLLVETGSLTPRLRLIDFGCGCILHPGRYYKFAGTDIPPEFYLRGMYRADQCTVWQLGVLIYHIVCGRLPFNTEREILRCRPEIGKELSRHCRDLLRSCLSKDPRVRPTLESLLLHPWLQSSDPAPSAVPSLASSPTDRSDERRRWCSLF
ncbi:serine/threonine-protein kinase pim-2-like [Diretmus argenteus]